VHILAAESLLLLFLNVMKLLYAVMQMHVVANWRHCMISVNSRIGICCSFEPHTSGTFVYSIVLYIHCTCVMNLKTVLLVED